MRIYAAETMEELNAFEAKITKYILHIIDQIKV